MAAETKINRKDVRATLVALIVADASWQSVVGYRPPNWDGQSPVMSVESSGTKEEDFTGYPTTRMRFLIRSSVLVGTSDNAGGWSSDDAEDLLDDLDLAIRDIVRDGVPDSGINAFVLDESNFSSTGYEIIGGELYRFEDRIILAEIN